VDMNRSKVWVVVDEIALPVMSLPFLYQAYQLLGRADKVAVLKNWLEDRKRRSPKALLHNYSAMSWPDD